MSPATKRLARFAVGFVIVAALAVVLYQIAGAYRAAKTQGSAPRAKSAGREAPGTSQTAPAPASSAAAPRAGTVVVLIDGLSMRTAPTPDARVVRPFKRGDTLVLLGKSKGWYRVRDGKGDVGWVTADPEFVSAHR